MNDDLWGSSREKRERILLVLERYEREGQPINKSAIAREARVSRWLLQQPDIAALLSATASRINSQLNSASRPSSPSAGSMRSQLASLRSRLSQAQTENRRLREAIETKLGHLAEQPSFRSLDEENVQLRATVKALKDQKRSLSAENARLLGQNRDLEDELLALRERMTILFRRRNGADGP